VLEPVASSILFPVRIELVFERNTSCKSEFSSWRNAHFVQTELYSQVEEKHVSLERKSSVLEAGASKTLFPC
jgi:hypothetical protein